MKIKSKHIARPLIKQTSIKQMVLKFNMIKLEEKSTIVAMIQRSAKHLNISRSY